MSSLNKEDFDIFFQKVVSPALKNEKESIDKIKAQQEKEETK